MDRADQPPSRKPSFREPVLWYVLGIGVFSGVVQHLLLITFPVFRRVFLTEVQTLGLLQSVTFSSALLFSVVSGWLTIRLGLRRALLWNLSLLSLAIAAIGATPGFGLVLALASCVGFCVAGMDIFTNALIASVFHDHRQPVFFLSGVSIAIGYAAGTAVIGRWFRDTEHLEWGWRSCYWAIAGILLLFAAVGRRLPPLGSAPAGAASHSLALSEVRSILRRKAIYIVGTAMFLHGLAQVGMVSWVGMLFQVRQGIDTAQAAYLLSANAFGFFLGRMLLSWVTARWRIPDLILLAACSGVGTLTYIATLSAPGYEAGLTLFFLSGMIVCGNGPAMYSYLGSRFRTQHASAFGLLSVFGYVGSSAGPSIIGLIGARAGVESGVWCIPLFSSLLFVLAAGSYAAESRGRRVAGSVTPVSEVP